MFKSLLLTLSLLSFQLISQTKEAYLLANRQDLRQSNFQFPQQDFKILGFGVYHGSSKSEHAELSLLNDLISQGSIKYYLPETDYSTAYYFNKYLQNGDTLLLKDLMIAYGDRVPQDGSIEGYKKWQALKQINDRVEQSKKIEVIGIDEIGCYKYTIKQLLTLIKPSLKNHKMVKLLKTPMKDHYAYSAYYDSPSRLMLKKVIELFETNQSQITPHLKDVATFKHLINNIKRTYVKGNSREATIFLNYKELLPRYNFDSNAQFARFGFFHLEKSREGEKGYPSFFTRLIENGIYKKNEVISIIGYLTKSKVLWERKYSKDDVYKGYTTRGGYGIGDYWLERFKGIKQLKKRKLSDMTLYRLNLPDSPYWSKEPDLMEIVMLLRKSNKDRVKGMSTLDFIDYSILITNSKANHPIQELNNNH